MLTAQQKQHFETFGFLVLRQLFAPQEIDVIRRESDAVLRENRQGKPSRRKTSSHDPVLRVESPAPMAH